MEADVFVVRDASAGIPEFIARKVRPNVSVLNAGEADVSHPTQGLLGPSHDTPAQAEPRWSDRDGDRRPQTFAGRTIPCRRPFNYGV